MKKNLHTYNYYWVMAELLEFIKNKPFIEVKQLFKPLFVDVKENDSLYMLCFTDKSDFSNKIVRQCTGTILEKNTNNIVHFSFEKCYDGIYEKIDYKNIEVNFSDLDINQNSTDLYNKEIKDYTVEKFIDGSIIKIYKYIDSWYTSTSKTIDANKNFWSSKKSFKKLVSEATKTKDIESFYDTLDENYMYTFLLQHPEIQCVEKSDVGCLTLLSKTDKKLIETRCEQEKVNLKLEELNRKTENYMLYIKNDSEITRIKLLSQQFKDRKQLLNNNPNIKSTYLDYLKDPEQLQNFRNKFPQYADMFYEMDDKIDKLCNELCVLYRQVYIEKTNPKIPKRYERTLSQLHGQYKKNRQFTDYNVVFEKIKTLEPYILHYILQINPMKKFKK